MKFLYSQHSMSCSACKVTIKRAKKQIIIWFFRAWVTSTALLSKSIKWAEIQKNFEFSRTEVSSNSNKNQKNPFQRKILFIEYLTLSVVILLVCKHTDSLTTNTVIPYQGLFLRKEKPRLFEPEKQETPSVPLLRGRRPPLSLPGGRRWRRPPRSPCLGGRMRAEGGRI